MRAVLGCVLQKAAPAADSLLGVTVSGRRGEGKGETKKHREPVQ